MPSSWSPQFLFAVCQRGAEAVLKQELGLRPSFSRPGFVTFKFDEPPAEPEQFRITSAFARLYGFGLGKVAGEHSAEMAESLWQLPAVEAFLAEQQISDLHVFERDSAVPGQRGFEPGSTALAGEVERVVRRVAPLEHLNTFPADVRPPSRRNRWVLDVVLVEPNEWWIGCHFAARRTDCYPGGVLPLELPPHAVSRAYLKMQEALEWSALPFSRGDVFVELGCAPGGAAQALIERGVQVIGVDPAEVDPAVAELEGFRHVRRRTVDLPRRELAGANWLAADMNVAPNYTLDAVEAIVVHPHSAIRGLVLTLKLADWQLAADVPAWIERIQGWGYRDVRVRQLAHNRQEVCVVALRSRAQRRVRRGRTQRRTDPTQTPQPHLPQQQ